VKLVALGSESGLIRGILTCQDDISIWVFPEMGNYPENILGDPNKTLEFPGMDNYPEKVQLSRESYEIRAWWEDIAGCVRRKRKGEVKYRTQHLSTRTC
jgi:hypothetical protein